jgi:glucosamine--fructose-6-phosphate aminotransferase (isomerizing)
MQTHMRREINEIPEAVARLIDTQRSGIAAAGLALKDKDPSFLVTVARGSSDHAATFLKYAVELTTGRPVASLGPSLASIYKVPLHVSSAAAICISQSGKSPDIVATGNAAKQGGALTIALTNTAESDIADASDHVIDIAAGPELAVAATKSYVSSIVAGLALLAEWQRDDALRRALSDLPQHLSSAVELDWSSLSERLGNADSLYMLGRGPSLAIASEAALKFKETSNMHAEAYSAAEVLHGPVALVENRFPVLSFIARDIAEQVAVDVVDGLSAREALGFATSDKVKVAHQLPFIATGHPLTDALALIVPFYGFVESWSRAKGFNPDQPQALKKVTETK